jgi:hypothetical protein
MKSMPIFSKARIIKQGLLLGGCLALGNVWAGGPEIAMAPPWTPLDAGISLYGMGGNGWTAIGDALIPMFGQANGFVFIDPQIYYHSDQNHEGNYSGDIGAGYRRLVDNNIGILGAYVFGDFNRGNNDKEFWFVSPGIERLGQILDFSANAYIPVSSQRQNTGTEFADQAGDSSQITFEGHNQFDALVNTFDSVGYGGDIQVGVHIPYFRNSEVFVGGYYFSPKDNDNVGGGAVRLQVPVNRYLSVLLSEAYDSEYHNTLKAGLTLWFGGRHTGYDFTGNLAERLVDPIQRNLVAVAGGSFTAQPILSGFENTGETQLELSNISFFVPDAPAGGVQPVQGDGTFENPYVGMTQANVDNANVQNNRNFYIDSGTYNPVYGMNNDYIILNNDQLFGRQKEFREAAQGAARPLMLFTEGGFEIPVGDVNDSITGLQLTGMNTNNAGIWIDHDNSTLNQTVAINNTAVQFFGDGIDIINGGQGALTVNVNDSWIANNNGTGELFSLFNVTGGIAAVNDVGAGLLRLNVKNSTITANNKVFDEELEFVTAAGGLAAANLGSAMTIDIDSSSLVGNAVSVSNNVANNTFPDGVGGGLAVINESLGSSKVIIDVDDSNLTGNSVTTDIGAIQAAGGLAAFNGFNENNVNNEMIIRVSDSNLSGNSFSADNGSIITAGGGLAVLNGGRENDELTLNVSHSNLSGNSASMDNVSTISAAGGLALFNANQMTVDVSYSDLSDNLISLDNNGSTLAAGGLAVLNGGQMTLDISHSNLLGNSISADNQSIVDTSGGLAIENDDQMDLDVSYSDLSNNLISVNNDSSAQAAGGLAVFSTDSSQITHIDVSYSNLSRNLIFADNAVSIGAAGGLATYNFESRDSGGNTVINVKDSNLSNNQISAKNVSTVMAAGGLAAINDTEQEGFNTVINVSQSELSNNSASADGSSILSTAGGLAAENLSSDAGSITVDIEKSALIFNSPSGIAVNGPSTTVKVKKSIIAWNENFGLSAINGAMIDVTKPVFFDGIVNIGAGSSIQFPGITNPVPDQAHVICPPFSGKCKIVMP